MKAMASELRRVGRRGWVQTPAWEFPIEPHYRMPFIHWLGLPGQAAAMKFKYRHASPEHRREIAERVNLVRRKEMTALFPDTQMFVERMALLPKSYVVTW